MCIAKAVSAWRHNENNLLIPYGLARDTAVSSHLVAAGPSVAAKIGQKAFLPSFSMLETQAVRVCTDCGKPLFAPVAGVLGAN
jgi:hypothetical protein